MIGYPMTGNTPAPCGDCAEILHGLSNVLTSTLLNAQMMEWKLPRYSRTKRYLHEIERNAQRGGELVKRLLGRWQAGCQVNESYTRTYADAPSLASHDAATANRDPDAAIRTAVSARDPAAVTAAEMPSHREMASASHYSVTPVLATFPKKGP